MTNIYWLCSLTDCAVFTGLSLEEAQPMPPEEVSMKSEFCHDLDLH